jgi:hypothetical protein
MSGCGGYVTPRLSCLAADDRLGLCLGLCDAETYFFAMMGFSSRLARCPAMTLRSLTPETGR